MFLSKRHLTLFLVLILAAMLAGCVAPPAATQPTSPPAAADTATPEPAATTASEPPAASSIILATTTSTQDSGLLDVILPDFQAETGIAVEVVAVGTGQALKLGEDCNADVVLVHARSREDEYMAAGFGTRREDVMYNDFVILGPEADPAAIAGLESAADSFKLIAETESPFVSRGDESGTHTKELGIWKAAGIEPQGAWYTSAGQGMGAVLSMADEMQAYTLSDRATYLARTLEGIDLGIAVEGDPALFNPYGVMDVNPARCPQAKNQEAMQFIDWLISLPTQEKIAAFGQEEFGQSLFIPDSAAWREANPS